MTDLTRLSASELSEKLKSREVSSVEVTQAHLDRIAAVDGEVHAFLHISADAIDTAEGVDALRRIGEDLGPLAGVPIAIKDVLCTLDMPSTAGSKILQGWIPPYDATVVRKLREANLVPLGKTNMDEFAMGSSTEHSAYGPTHNPWDLDRIPGGSGGGSAAAVASFEAPLALGSDTGGSIRQPAALTGVVGMKPTYGRVPRWGVVAFASSLDQVGPFANTVEDVAIVCEAIFGKDANDATMVTDFPNDDLRRDLDKGVKGMRLGVPKEYFSVKGMEPGVERAVRDALKVLESQGAKLEEVSLSLTDHGLAVYYIIQPAEASSNLARYDGIRYGLRVEGRDLLETYRRTRGQGFGPEVKRRMILGTYALSAGYYDAFYVKAQKVRTLIKDEYDRVFEKVDALVTPTSPTVAFKIGAKVNDPLSMYLNDIFTLPVNISGLPGISVPCGLSEGLPVGLQVIANSYQERTMFRVAAAYERATPHHLERPKEKAA